MRVSATSVLVLNAAVLETLGKDRKTEEIPATAWKLAAEVIGVEILQAFADTPCFCCRGWKLSGPVAGNYAARWENKSDRTESLLGKSGPEKKACA